MMDREKQLIAREELESILELELVPRQIGQTFNGVTAEMQQSVAKEFSKWLDRWEFNDIQSFMTFLNAFRNTLKAKENKELILFIREFNTLFGKCHESVKGVASKRKPGMFGNKTKVLKIKTWTVRKDLTHKNLINWNNYTISKKRFLIVVCYSRWFPDLATKEPAVVLVKGMEARGHWNWYRENMPGRYAEKTEAFPNWKRDDKFPIETTMGYPRRFILYNGQALAKGIITNFRQLKTIQVSMPGKHKKKRKEKPEYDKVSSYLNVMDDPNVSHIVAEKTRGGDFNPGLHSQYECLKTCAFKDAINYLSSFGESKKVEKKLESRGERNDKLKTKHKIDWISVKHFLRTWWPEWQPFANIEVKSTKFNKTMTIVFKKLKLTRYKELPEQVDLLPEEIDVKLCKQFMSEVDSAISKWDFSKL